MQLTVVTASGATVHRREVEKLGTVCNFVRNRDSLQIQWPAAWIRLDRRERRETTGRQSERVVVETKRWISCAVHVGPTSGSVRKHDGDGDVLVAGLMVA